MKDKNIIKGPLPFVGFLETKKDEVPKGWKKVEIKK